MKKKEGIGNIQGLAEKKEIEYTYINRKNANTMIKNFERRDIK